MAKHLFPDMPKMDTEMLVNRGRERFGDQYDYSETYMVGDIDTKIYVTCRHHNHRFRLAVRQHIYSLYGGCDYCMKANRDYRKVRQPKREASDNLLAEWRLKVQAAK